MSVARERQSGNGVHEFLERYKVIFGQCMNDHHTAAVLLQAQAMERLAKAFGNQPLPMSLSPYDVRNAIRNGLESVINNFLNSRSTSYNTIEIRRYWIVDNVSSRHTDPYNLTR